MKNSTKFLGIIVLAAAGFGILACSTGDEDKNDGGFLANLKPPKDVKSIYLSDMLVKGGGRAAAGSNTISSLSYITPTGQNAPVLFSTSGKKQLIFEVTGVEQLGERCIIIGIDGYYEVTGTGAAGSYTVGPKVETWAEGIRSVLIDMKNGKLYDFTEFYWYDWSLQRFMEGDIIYTPSLADMETVYKIDLSTAAAGSALQAVPLNNGAFLPINGITLPYTISNKLIGRDRSSKIMCLDVSGTKQPQQYKDPVLTPDELPGYTGDYQETGIGILGHSLIRDLTGKPWAFISYSIDASYPFDVNSSNKYFYLIADVSIDDTGQCTLNIGKNGELAISDSYYDGFDFFTFNAAGVGNAYYYPYNDSGRDAYHLRSFLNNGVVMINARGFIRLYPEVDGIKVESVKLDMPTVSLEGIRIPTVFLEGRSVISSENYLFWLENKTIKRLKLAAGSSPQDVYSNNGIIERFASRNLLTASGRKIIFYQYAAGSATEVHTYSLDMYIPGAQPELLATNDAEVRSIVELDF